MAPGHGYARNKMAGRPIGRENRPKNKDFRPKTPCFPAVSAPGRVPALYLSVPGVLRQPIV